MVLHHHIPTTLKSEVYLFVFFASKKTLAKYPNTANLPNIILIFENESSRMVSIEFFYGNKFPPK